MSTTVTTEPYSELVNSNSDGELQSVVMRCIKESNKPGHQRKTRQ
jgi:hypothetical protein